MTLSILGVNVGGSLPSYHGPLPYREKSWRDPFNERVYVDNPDSWGEIHPLISQKGFKAYTYLARIIVFKSFQWEKRAHNYGSLVCAKELVVM